MIALGDLHQKNGLITNARTASLASGQDLVLDGDGEMYFSEGGGGMALFLVLDLVGKVTA